MSKHLSIGWYQHILTLCSVVASSLFILAEQPLRLIFHVPTGFCDNAMMFQQCCANYESPCIRSLSSSWPQNYSFTCWFPTAMSFCASYNNVPSSTVASNYSTVPSHISLHVMSDITTGNHCCKKLQTLIKQTRQDTQ